MTGRTTNDPQRFLRESGYILGRDGREYVGSDAERYSREESNRRVAAREQPVYATTRDLELIREACIAVASRHLEPGDLSPLAGCCAAVATMLRGMFGGCILKGTVNGCSHFWNQLGDGRVVDLTSCQFGGDGMHPLVDGEFVELPELIDPMFLAFAIAVQEELANQERILAA